METNILKMATVIHQNSLEMGWWKPFPRVEDRHYELMIWATSEFCEAWVGNRKNLMDNRLPHYPMFHVELADVCIVLLDLYGAYKLNTTRQEFDGAVRFMFVELSNKPIDEQCVRSLRYIYSHSTKQGEVLAGLACATAMANLNGVPLLKIIKEKVQFNKNRADHKAEAGAR